jgi:hypothetical protein
VDSVGKRFFGCPCGALATEAVKAGLLFVQGGADDLLGVAEALAGEAEDCGAVDETVDGRDGGGLGGEEVFRMSRRCPCDRGC